MEKHGKKSARKEFRKKAFLFSAKFFIIFAVLYSLLFITDLSAVENWLASSEAQALGLQSSGNQVAIGGSVFLISESCIGLFSGMVLLAIAFACKKPSLGKKALIAGTGIALLFVINWFRVFAVLWFGKNSGFQAAEIAHAISWFAMTAFILGIWYLLTKRVAGKNFQELI
ncbi:MAG: exosortase/archaeosortase family protein [Candidatus Diapherotrites archaeon]|uniref:Exosortase/archaeosortase family protein n=2 Tax=Candidatus Iainarchaeum sp. TaxID=3101447 RepID=A0A8T4KUF3_9ARCH|nr:exosortase/archaeosortase family protein [Candidatus Diapherotrites archaeon]